MNSTFSSQNADNMSRKSEFSNAFSFESPCVNRELPHHLQTFGGRGSGKIIVVGSILIIKIGNADFTSFNDHVAAIITREYLASSRDQCSKSSVTAVSNRKIWTRARTRLKSTKAVWLSCGE